MIKPEININLTLVSDDVEIFIQLLNEGGFKVQSDAVRVQWDTFNKPMLRKITTEELQGLRVSSYEYIDLKSKLKTESGNKNIELTMSRPKNCTTCIDYGNLSGSQYCFECIDYVKHRFKNV